MGGNTNDCITLSRRAYETNKSGPRVVLVLILITKSLVSD